MNIEPFEEKLIEYANELIGYLIKLGVNKQDAQDISQDSFIKLIEVSYDLKPDKVKPWLYRVALNNYYNIYNRKKRYQEIIQLHFHSGFSDEFSADYSELYDGLKRMDTHSMNILLMKYEQGLSIKEIAFILKKPETSIKTELYRARKKLKKMIERNEINGDERS